jgi:ribose transport system permease protein
MWAALLAGMGVGAAAGAVNGALVTLGGLPPFVATLAMLSSARGLALLVSGGQTITGFPTWFVHIVSRSLLGPFTLAHLIMAVILIVGAAYLRYRPGGRGLFAVGGGEEVARLSGINVRSATFKVYVIAGFLASVGGLLLVSRLNSASPIAAEGFELDVIAAVVIGGASLAGGRGSVLGTFLGALIIVVLRNGLTLLNVASYMQQVIIGVVIALAVMTDTFHRRKR